MASPCNNSPDEVIEKIVSAKANADKFDKFVNGTDMQTVQLGSGHPTPTIRNAVRQIKADGEWIKQFIADAPEGDVSLNNVTALGSTTSRTLTERFADVINVRDYGVKGDGVTDDTAAIQAAINAAHAQGGGTVWIPEDMTCKCTAAIEGKAGVSMKCEPSSWLDFRGTDDLARNATDALIGWRGVAGSPILLQSDAVKGENLVLVPDATEFAIGDMIDISINGNGRWIESEGQTPPTAGQVAVVIGSYSDTNAIVISEPFYDTYSVANGARIRKITPIEDIVIDGLGIIGNGRPEDPSENGEQGLKFFFGRNIQIKNCRIKHVDGRAIDIVECYGATIENNRLDFEPLGINSDDGHVSYGIAYSGSMNIRIDGNSIINPRSHIISSHYAASSGYWCVSRNIEICNNILTSNYGSLTSAGWSLAHGAVASHMDVEFVRVHHNRIIGCRFGVDIRSNDWIVENNDFDSCKVGIYPALLFRDITIKDNNFNNCGGIFNTGAVDNTDENVNKQKGIISFVGNKCINSGFFGLTLPTVSGTKTLLVDNSFIYTEQDANPNGVIEIYNETECIFKGNYALFRNAGGRLLRVDTTGYVCCSGNSIEYMEPCTRAPVYIVNSLKFSVTDNVFHLRSTQGAVVGKTKKEAPLSIFSGNVFIIA